MSANPSVTRKPGSRNPASRQRRIMSPVPVPMRSMYWVWYSDSANSGLCGTEPCGSRRRSIVRLEGKPPGFHTSNRSANNITCTLPVLV